MGPVSTGGALKHQTVGLRSINTNSGIMSINNDTSMTVKKALSQSTQNILSLVTDPYHDFNLQAVGYPDGKSLYSCIQRFQNRMTLKCPFTLAAGDTWGINIVTTGLHYQQNMAISSYSAGLIDQTATTTVACGPIHIIYTHYDSTGTTKTVIRNAMGPPTAALAGRELDRSRIVSLGFELTNTTAELYKEGSLTVYRLNAIEDAFDGRLKYSNVTPTTAPWSGNYIANIPLTEEAINSLPNVRTWEAGAGAYCVALPQANNAYSDPAGCNTLIQEYFLFGPTLTQSALVYPMILNATPPTAVMGATALNNVGVITSKFKSAEQNFSLDFRMVLETETNGASPLIGFATKPPELDRAFLKLYKAMIPLIPPGVPVGFNDSGEWFRRILKIANSVLPIIASVLPGHAKVIATAAVPVVSALNTIVQRREERKQQSSNPNNNQKPNKTNRMMPSKKQ